VVLVLVFMLKCLLQTLYKMIHRIFLDDRLTLVYNTEWTRIVWKMINKSNEALDVIVVVVNPPPVNPVRI
jgi:uncharacterized protein YqkB